MLKNTALGLATILLLWMGYWIYSVENMPVSDQIDGTAEQSVEVVPTIKIISPRASDKIKVADIVDVAWKSEAAPDDAVVHVYLVSENDEEDLSDLLYTGSPADLYQWLVPSKRCAVGKCTYPLASGSYKIIAQLVPENFCKQLYGPACAATSTDKVYARGESEIFSILNTSYVMLSGGFANTEVENGVMTVPRGTAVTFWWNSEGVTGCKMSPSLPQYANGDIGKSGNALSTSISNDITYTIRCELADKTGFVEDSVKIEVEFPEKITYTNATADMITVELPFPGAVTGKDFTVVGKARGTWYFEASFPIEVLDAKGTKLATGIAQAEGEWMTENFVPFKSTIVVPQNYIGPATLVLKKDNPSGMPEHDASISFPITIEY